MTMNMTLTLDAAELQALMTALDRYLPELEFELARVKLERHRHDLVALDSALRSIRARLGEIDASAGQPPLSTASGT
jgi:hypothetical protein